MKVYVWAVWANGQVGRYFWDSSSTGVEDTANEFDVFQEFSVTYTS